MKLAKTRDASGFSIATWIFTLLGLTTSVAYPLKKGFPISTYIELVMLTLQSVGILGLVCFLKGKLTEYIIGMSVFGIAAFALWKAPITVNYLSAMQVVAALLCNWANIPQMILNFQNQNAAVPFLTTAMSLAGNIIRIFTTLQLTKDPFVLGGYLLGFTTNAVLLGQTFVYGSK